MAFAHPEKIVDELRLQDGMEVADFGAGAGYLAIAAAQRVGEQGTVYVIDIQEELLTKARNLANQSHLKSLHFIHGDLEEPGGSELRDDLCDVVIMANILFQLEKKDVALAEAWRILKPDGLLAIVDWTDSFGGLGPQLEYIVPEARARQLAEARGLAFERSFNPGDHHYGVLFRK